MLSTIGENTRLRSRAPKYAHAQSRTKFRGSLPARTDHGSDTRCSPQSRAQNRYHFPRACRPHRSAAPAPEFALVPALFFRAYRQNCGTRAALEIAKFCDEFSEPTESSSRIPCHYLCGIGFRFAFFNI